MRRILFSLILLLAACAPRPQAQPQPAPVQPTQVVPPPQPRASQLVGLTMSELVGHFGSPALQVREGTSLKLQFRGRSCVLDAYLYPSRDGALRVTYVDTRTPSGTDTNQAACISALEYPS
jgi:hypothetical protein